MRRRREREEEQREESTRESLSARKGREREGGGEERGGVKGCAGSPAFYGEGKLHVCRKWCVEKKREEGAVRVRATNCRCVCVQGRSAGRCSSCRRKGKMEE